MKAVITSWSSRFHTYEEALLTGTEELKKAMISDADIDAKYLLEDLCGLDKTFLTMRKANQIPNDKYEAYMELIKRRALHEPLQQILGYTIFMGLRFNVSKDVLCPRQDTESLVETVISELKANDSILDMCTGSGCILISILALGSATAPKESLSGTGCDISEEALSLARENAELNKVKAEFLCGDLFGALEGTESQNNKYSVIVSNPPYIATPAMWGLMPEVRDHEPQIALDGGDKGLNFYEKIIPAAKSHMTNDGRLYVEIGYDQADAVSELFKNNGYSEIEVKKDYAGNDRIVKGRYHV